MYNNMIHKTIMDYEIKHAIAAYNMLSKPFKTVKHVCASLNVTIVQYLKWLEEESTFKGGVEAGLIKGEAKARDLLFICSLRSANSKNTKLLTLLAEEVYGISSVEGIDEEVPPESITIEVEDASKNSPSSDS